MTRRFDYRVPGLAAGILAAASPLPATSAPAQPTLAVPASAAANATGLSASVVNPVAGVTYSWTVTGPGTAVSGASTPNLVFNTGGAGTITLSCAAANAYGHSSAGATVQVNGAPAEPTVTVPASAGAYASGLSASVVNPVAGISYSWVLTGPGSVVSGASSANLVFNAGAPGLITLSCAAANVYGHSSAGATVQVIGSATETPAQAIGYYGSGLNVDSLANTPIGEAEDYEVSYRIRANHTGLLQAIRTMFIWSSTEAGYASGTGGTIQVQVQTDDGSIGHNPSGTVLASTVYTFPAGIINSASSAFYPQLVFATPPQLQAGNLYHLVFTDIDADRSANWVCVDQAYMDCANSPMQPTVPNTDLATLWRAGGAWSPRGSGYSPMESFTPIVELDYADGASQGQGYIEFWLGDPKIISGSQSVRETFTVTGTSRTVASASVRVKYFSGSDPLTIRLEQGDGTLIDVETVDRVPVTAGFDGASWVTVTFATPRTLSVGQNYHLVLSSPGTSVFTAFPMRKGSDKGFKPTTVFTDGHAEFNPGAGWTGWDTWGGVNRTDGDLQFYFTVVDQ